MPKAYRSEMAVPAFLPAILALFVLFPGSPPHAESEVSAGDGVRPTVAVFDFAYDGPPDRRNRGYYPRLIAQGLLRRIADREDLAAVERPKLQLVLEELHVGSGELADEATRLRLGRLLGADRFVFGSYLFAGETLLLSAHIVDTDSGVVLAAADSYGSPERLDEAVGLLAQRLLDGYGPEGVKTSPVVFEGEDGCPGGRRRAFVVTAAENRIDHPAWQNRLIALGIRNLVDEELFATGCYVPSETDPEIREAVDRAIMDGWIGKSTRDVPKVQAPPGVPKEVEIRAVVKSFSQSGSSFFFGPFSSGKTTVEVVVELFASDAVQGFRRAEGAGEASTRASAAVFRIRDGEVRFDESAVGTALHEAIREAAEKLADPTE